MSGFLVGNILFAFASSFFFLLKLCGNGIYATKLIDTAFLKGSFGAYGAMRASRVCSLFFCCSLLLSPHGYWEAMPLGPMYLRAQNYAVDNSTPRVLY